jgi:hypothetical protein
MIQCKAESRYRWRVSLSTALRKKMTALEMKYDVEETFMTALYDWMENNEVDINKFPPRLKAALASQVFNFLVETNLQKVKFDNSIHIKHKLKL